MSNTIIRIKYMFPDVNFIGTRPSGEMIREKMEQEFEKSNTVVLDFVKFQCWLILTFKSFVNKKTSRL